MPTKRELKKQIDELTERLTYLENMHAKFEDCSKEEQTWFDSDYRRKYIYHDKVGWYDGTPLTSDAVRCAVSNPHPFTREHTASTEKLKDITLEELARYVLDGTPIARKCFKSVEYNTTYAPDSITKSVSTDLGNISIEEGIG